jgi:hypothetical protein
MIVFGSACIALVATGAGGREPPSPERLREVQSQWAWAAHAHLTRGAIRSGWDLPPRTPTFAELPDEFKKPRILRLLERIARMPDSVARAPAGIYGMDRNRTTRNLQIDREGLDVVLQTFSGRHNHEQFHETRVVAPGVTSILHSAPDGWQRRRWLSQHGQPKAFTRARTTLVRKKEPSPAPATSSQ